MDEEATDDSISNLPDAILHSILSLVPTKSVIRVSCLSKRWKAISEAQHTYANSFDFGVDFAKHQSPDQFSDNVNNILSINKSKKIDRFKLVFSPRNEQHKYNVIEWIKFATSRGVKEIDLDLCRHIRIHFWSRNHILGGIEAFELPSFFFECESLVCVKLRRCIFALPENYAVFCSLQTLYLKEVLVTDSMLESLLISCKLLEVLVLKECGSLSRIRIMSSDRLKKLTIYECYNASILEISGQKIRSLLVSSGHLDSCKLENMPMLEEVFVGTRGDEFGGVLYIFYKVLSNLAHVRILTLYLGHLVPSLMKDFHLKFSNLQELQLINSPLLGLFNTDVYCFFKHFTCPVLQKITVELSTVSEEENFIWEYRKPNVQTVECKFDNLKAVTLRNFRGTSSDIELATYFLMRASYLELMLLIVPPKSIATSSTSKTDMDIIGIQEDIYDKLMYHPKTSPDVTVKVAETDEHNIFLSIFKWHNVSDVYHK